MKTDEDVRSALVHYMRRPDEMLVEIAKMRHEDLVIFTMQLLNLNNVERELIHRIAQQGGDHHQTDLDLDDDRRRSSSSKGERDLLSMSPQEGLCDVSGIHEHVSNPLMRGDDVPTLASPVMASRSGPPSPQRARMLSVPKVAVTPSTSPQLEEEDETQDPVMWKLNLLTQMNTHAAEVAVRAGGDAWGED